MKRKDLSTNNYYEVLLTPNAYDKYLNDEFDDVLIRLKPKYRSITDADYSTVYLARCTDECGSDHLEYHSQSWYELTTNMHL